MNERDYRLQQFFSAYFNQDWDANSATNWCEVMDEYHSENAREGVTKTISDLRSWLAESNPGQRLPVEFGCEYNPEPDGLEERAWVEKLAEYLENKTNKHV